MKYLLVLILLYLATFTSLAQDFSCESPDTFLADVSGYLDVLSTWDDIDQIDLAIRTSLNKCNLANVVADEIGRSRSNPVPVGEWFKIYKGKMRIVSVETEVSLEELSDYSQSTASERLTEESNIISFKIEYECSPEDIDLSCEGTDATGGVSSYISTSGVVTDSVSYVTRDPETNIFILEGYSGVLLSGWFTLVVPTIDEPLGIWRANLSLTESFSFTEVFFSLTE
jgi:hypothetical protein